jgi:membrane protein implicated in regulation of membrane protease activity
MNYRKWSLVVLVVGILLWIGGAALVLFTDAMALQVLGVVLFAAGPLCAMIAGRMVRKRTAEIREVLDHNDASQNEAPQN